jgi:hypothetical protein
MKLIANCDVVNAAMSYTISEMSYNEDKFELEFAQEKPFILEYGKFDEFQLDTSIHAADNFLTNTKATRRETRILEEGKIIYSITKFA